MTAIRLLLLSALLAPAALAQTWTPQNSGTAVELTGVHFISATTGVAVGEGGVALRTTDGGETWSAQTLPAEDLEAVAFNPSGTVGIAVSDDGPVFRTTDGGATWSFVATGAGDLRDVDWADDDVVWVAGRDGDAAVSTDAGLTWAYRNTGSAERTESVAAVSAAEAFVGNREGELRRTTDGGLTWAPVFLGTDRDLNDIQMLGTTGYISGNGDTVLKTTDGGATWADASNGSAGDEGLFFLDAATGWVVGDGGEIWFTDDGGASWTLQPSGTAANLTEVHFPTPSDGWAVGEGGAIVKFSGITTAAEPGASPRGFALSEAHPNPFTRRAAFTLEVAEAQHVQAEVYDALGRRVVVLHDGVMEAGAHALVLDGSSLPAGVYVVRVTGEAFAATRRAVLLR